MLGIIFYGICVLTGYSILRLIELPLSKSERAAASIAIGFATASWLGLLLAFALGAHNGLLATTIVLMVTNTALLYKTRPRASTQLREPSPGSPALRLANWALVGLTGIFLVGLCLSHFLPTMRGNLMSAGYTWADLALHTTLIASLAKKPAIDLTLPIFAGSKLTYPFLVDFFSAQMLRLGAGWQWSLLLPSLALMYGFVRLFMSLIYRLTRSLRATWIGLALVLLSGSAWGMVLFLKDLATSGLSVHQLLLQDYSKLDQNNLQYANFITSHLLPQRAYLFGIVVAMLIIILLWELVTRHKSHNKYRSMAMLAGLLLGALPLIHTHSFLVVMGFAGVLWIVSSLRVKKVNQELFWVLLIGGVLAAPQLAWQFSGSYHEGFGYWRLGWLTPSNMGILTFWLRQLGVMALLFGLGPYLLYRQKAHYFVSTLYWFGVALFVIGNIYIFQPSAWDNMKFFTYAYWMMLIPVVAALASISRAWWGKIVLFVILALTCGTGIIALAREGEVNYTFATQGDLAVAYAVERAVPPSALILVNPDLHHNPITNLSGRNTLVGYNGWLWSYGINYLERDQDARKMMQGEAGAAKLLGTYGIDYVAFSDDDIASGAANNFYYDFKFSQIINQNNWHVYKIR